mgnify:CR=1 FL=1
MPGHRGRIPPLAGTPGGSVHVTWGRVRPRRLLAYLAARPGARAARYATQLAWREFYADVLWAQPDSAREYLRPEFARMEYDEPGAYDAKDRHFNAWRDGRTGYPTVDEGMRQLRSEG